MSKKEYQSPLVLIGEGESFKDELCQMIESARMFSDFSRAEVQNIANYTHAYEVVPGATLFREGEKGQYMCLIVEGKVNILKDTGDGERKVITTVRAGQTMGEMSLLDDLPYSATATAKELGIERSQDFEKNRPPHEPASASDHRRAGGSSGIIALSGVSL